MLAGVWAWDTSRFRRFGRVVVERERQVNMSNEKNCGWLFPYASSHLLRMVFRFHYHSQKVIGSLGFDIGHQKLPRYMGMIIKP